jgi:uncharacterized protein YdgA (DUF945 family)
MNPVMLSEWTMIQIDRLVNGMTNGGLKFEYTLFKADGKVSKLKRKERISDSELLKLLKGEPKKLEGSNHTTVCYTENKRVRKSNPFFKAHTGNVLVANKNCF